jgi:hypothetical protein
MGQTQSVNYQGFKIMKKIFWEVSAMGQNEPLNLLMFDGEVETFFSWHRQQVTEGNTFLLSSVLFRNFAEVINNILQGMPASVMETESALRNFYREISGSDEILDQPIPVENFNFNYRQIFRSYDPGPDERGTVSYSWEVLALYGMIVTWLEPREVNGGQLIAKLWLGDVDNNYFFKQRCRQFYSCPTVVSQKLTFVHDSPGILPLCWAELLNAVYQQEKASICPFCHDVYHFPHTNHRKATCGRPGCKKAYLIRQHGGMEGYRAWEKKRKQKARDKDCSDLTWRASDMMEKWKIGMEDG